MQLNSNTKYLKARHDFQYFVEERLCQTRPLHNLGRIGSAATQIKLPKLCHHNPFFVIIQQFNRLSNLFVDFSSCLWYVFFIIAIS